jgi:hypothetical protein
MVLETIGVVLVFGTIWAALQFEGNPGQESHTASDERGGLISDGGRTERVPKPLSSTSLAPTSRF